MEFGQRNESNLSGGAGGGGRLGVNGSNIMNNYGGGGKSEFVTPQIKSTSSKLQGLGGGGDARANQRTMNGRNIMNGKGLL